MKVPVHVVPPVLGVAEALGLADDEGLTVEDAEALVDVARVELDFEEERVELDAAASLERHCE